MIGKHILVVGNPTIAVSGALSMIQEFHGTTEVRMANEMPNDTQMPQPEAVVVIEYSHSKRNIFEFIEFEKADAPREPMNRKERRHGFIENNEPWRKQRKVGGK